MKWPSLRKKKLYVPRSDIPEQNDKEATYNKKSRWDMALLLLAEGIIFAGMFILDVNAWWWGFTMGLLITIAECAVPLFIISFFYMWRKVTLTEKIGKHDGIDLTAYNLEGKKYETNYLIEDVAEIEDDSMGSGLKMYEFKGAYRKNKPLEQFALLSNQGYGEHLEFHDSTTTFYYGAISVKKDVPSLSIKQIGNYGEHQLPLMRVDSSCVSRKDSKLLEADLPTVLKAIEAEDKWRAKSKDKEIMGFQKTEKSHEDIIKGLLEKLEKIKMQYRQVDEVGEEDTDKTQPTKFEQIKPYLILFCGIALGALILFVSYKMLGVV